MNDADSKKWEEIKERGIFGWNSYDVDWLIAKVKEQDRAMERLREQDKQVEIALLATRQQRDDEFNRAEKLEEENAELKRMLSMREK